MKVTDKLTLKSGKELSYRIVQAPMVTQGANLDGTISQENLDYYGARSKVAGAIIVEACYVEEAGKGFTKQIGVSDDKHIEGLTELAKAIKKDGALAIMQIHHAGREAITAYQTSGVALAPSKMEFDFLDYPVTEMTDEQIKATIKAFGEATRRAYEAGFDGVEIHGANHYLIQQFFSNYSNHRTDNWGGSFDKRMNFPLAVVEEVKQVVQHFENNFIVGYRISPEEIHGITIGYDYKESAELVKKLERYGLDYIHISNFDKFDMGPEGLDGSYVELYKKAIGNETPLITVSNVFTQADVENALALADIVAIGRAALLDPEFTHKLTHQRKDEIVSEMSEDVMAYVKWPQGLYDWYRDGAALPQVPNLESLL